MDNLIWLGRRTAYLGRFRDAISIFTRGIEKFPKDARMYRHRGHRFITLRRFNLACDDLLKAANLVKDKTDQVEPDGIPNARGIPVSTLHSNIWYHLGLASYLLKDYATARFAYEKCLEVSRLDDNYVSTGHWLYMTLRLLNKEPEAEQLLENVSKDMDIIENHHYHDLLLMYKGEITPEKLLEHARKEGSLSLSTIGYGIANWFIYNDRKEQARDLLEEILALESWASFGYIAAEVALRDIGR